MIIYKYLNQDGAIKTIKSNSVLLNTPLKFNDPFDCETNITEEENNKAFELFLNYQLFKGLYDFFVKKDVKAARFKTLANKYKEYLPLAGSKIKKTKKYVMQDYLMPCRPFIGKYLGKTLASLRIEFKQVIKDSFKKLKKRIVVSCFGSKFDSVLMWSHYADKHKGACVEYEINDKDFKQVDYKKEMPTFRLFDTLEILFGHQFSNKQVDFESGEYDFMSDALLTKSLDWEYEGEIRCVYSAKKLDPKIRKVVRNRKKKLLLKMPNFKAIYIGCSASAAFEKAIKRISNGVPIYRMKKKDGEYGLVPERIKI